MAERPYDAVLCDIDGVLRQWDPVETAELERRYVIPAGKLLATALAPERIRPALTGKISDEEWRAWVARAMLPYCGSVQRASLLVSEWSARLGRVDVEVLDLLGLARRSVPVALVGNGTTRLEGDLAALGVAGAADLVVTSARLGVAKPDPAIYLAAARLMRVAPERCLCVDGARENVLAARSLGMSAWQYGGPDTLRRAFAPLAPVPVGSLPAPGRVQVGSNSAGGG